MWKKCLKMLGYIYTYLILFNQISRFIKLGEAAKILGVTIQTLRRWGETNYLAPDRIAAALCIARRHQKFSEAPCSPVGNIPDGRWSYAAFVMPVRNRTKHVWYFWGQVKKRIGTVLAAHFRAILNRYSSPPSSTPVIGNSWLLLV